MSQQIINIGTADAHGGDNPFVSWTKAVSNFSELYGLAIPMTNIAEGLVPTPPNDNTKFLNGTGNWTVPAGGGGFSNPMTTLGDIIYENATPTAARLAGNTTAVKQFLTQTGNGSISAVPVWGAISAGDIPTLNQNTTGNAATVTTIPTLSGDVSNTANSISVIKILGNTLPANGVGALTNNGSGGLTWAPPGQLGFSTTVTAAGTTTLTTASNYYQYFTGTTIQTVVLPVVSTMVLGQSFEIDNLSTGTLTVNSSGGNLVVTVPAGSRSIVTCIAITGTSNTSWNYFIDTPNPMTAQYDMLYGGGLVNGVAYATRIPNGTTGQFLAATTGGPPSWGTPTAASYSVNQNSLGTFGLTNSNTGTGTSIGITYTLGSTIWGYNYVTPSNYATGTFANAMVWQASAANGLFIWSNGATIEMQLDASKYLRVANRIIVGTVTSSPDALIKLSAGTATAGTSPLKFTAPAALLTTPEALTIEPAINGDYLNFTTTTGTKRRVIIAGTSGRVTAQTAANASVSTYTLGATDASYEVSANVLVTTSSAEAFTVTVDYTDEGNTARTITLNFQIVAGTISTAINFANGAIPYHGLISHIRCKASTAITVKTTGTFTGATYNVEGIIKQTN